MSENNSLRPVQLETLSFTKLLGVSIGRDFGALKGLKQRAHTSSCNKPTVSYTKPGYDALSGRNEVYVG